MQDILTPQQIENMARRRVELARQTADIQAELARIEALESGENCDRCEASSATATPRTVGAEMLCARCAALARMEDAAAQELDQTLTPLIAAWSVRWSAAGLSADSLGAQLALFGEYWTHLGARGAVAPAGYPSAVAHIEEALEIAAARRPA